MGKKEVGIKSLDELALAAHNIRMRNLGLPELPPGTDLTNYFKKDWREELHVSDIGDNLGRDLVLIKHNGTGEMYLEITTELGHENRYGPVSICDMDAVLKFLSLPEVFLTDEGEE